jgi:hypothetical protein
MSVTVTLPSAGDLARLFAAVAQPCLLAAAEMAGVGTVGLLVLSAVLRIAQHDADAATA